MVHRTPRAPSTATHHRTSRWPRSCIPSIAQSRDGRTGSIAARPTTT